MDNIRDYFFLGIFGFLVLHNALVIVNILFSPAWMNKRWLSFPSGDDKFRKVLYCLYAILLFIIFFHLRMEKISGR